MSDRAALPPADRLERELGALADAIAWPAAPDLATSVARRIATAPAPERARPLTGWRHWLLARPLQRSLLVAAALVLVLAAVAAAATLLFPGLRLVTLPPGSTLTPVPSATIDSPPGLSLGIGAEVTLADAERLAGFPPLLPADAAIGPPDDVHVAAGRVNLVWRTRPTLPETQARGIGLIVTQFRGRVDEGWYEKQLIEGSSRVERAEVAGTPAFWISGRPHVLIYVDGQGRFVEETRRVVGDVLIWRRDGITIRIESALGRDATIALAETIGG